ncbi:flavoprotein [Crossiella cryophila]|uniref:Phosphopantothenoylcysteine decarboxylase/phosphopantothenate--cysteine ligase n=1 Tax=Crossiella cryophila TaxID=43355 RepID=A0A7W7CC21_9PSEU|nr:flavoprotein [Crossiella cryophila]MBB4678373.1 phosphopantothenoylcysteine decarboxylase/phosphopantothenate--cysteine ligase [Crossiella cryophila]
MSAPGFDRLLFVGTGAASAAFLPFWLNWLQLTHPALDTRVVLTRTAQRFVTREALAGFSARPVLTDGWPDEPSRSALHVELAEWAEAIVVYPATLHFTARLALGLADSPALLAAQCATAPIAVAPSLPPGGADSAAYRGHQEALRQRDNVVVVPPQPGLSRTTGRQDAWVCADLPVVLTELSALHAGAAR